MDRRQDSHSATQEDPTSDLEAQRSANQKDPGVHQTESPIATGTAMNDSLIPSAAVRVDVDDIEHYLAVREWNEDPDGQRSVPSSDITKRFPDQSLPARVKALKERYDPFLTNVPEGADDVLTFLYHRNISYARTNLLKRYSFFCGNSKLYVDAWEDPLKWLQRDLDLYMQAEKSYCEWNRLSPKEKTRQNSRIYPDDLPHELLQTLGIIECASLYDRPEEREALAHLRQLSGFSIKVPYTKESKAAHIRSGERRKEIEKEKERIKFFSRAGTAVFGGLAVIAPMLIMSLHPTRLTQLLTASLFVVSIALILAWLMDDAERKDMIAATAAYAAVLVVFVGAASTAG